MTALILTIIGTLGAVAVWILSVRPYVVSNRKGYITGAHFGIALWVDWQSCGEIAKAKDDAKGRKIYRAFAFFQLISAIGIVLLIFAN